MSEFSDEFERLRKSTTLGGRQFVEEIDDLLRGARRRIPRAQRTMYKLSQTYGWDATLKAARLVAEAYKR